MSQLPFELPKSLVSYAEHFQQKPQNAIFRLERQLNKRGPDAVGHFLLAWFYHLQNRNDEAVEQALKAKIYAPGSPFFEKLHYYLVHPDRFDAWTPEASRATQIKTDEADTVAGPVLNLDALIEKLAEVESERITLSEDQKTKTSISSDSGETDDIASDTLANIHETQGKTEAAIRTYTRLKKLNKHKKEYYEEKIAELKELQKKREEQREGNGEEE